MGVSGFDLRTSPDAPRRIAVVGSVGGGKSTLARALARQAGLPYVELDSLRYQPDWQRTADEAFYNAVVQLAGGDEWVIDGNYETTRDIVWLRARLLVWVDYPLRIALWRLLRRTIDRLRTREAFANGNRESLRRLLGRESIFLWAIRSHRPRRKRLAELVANARYSHLRVVRLQSPRDADAWLAQELPSAREFIASNTGDAKSTINPG